MGRFALIAVVSLCGCNQVFGIQPLGPCRDEDGDGYDTCLPDCDDTDPAMYPGLPEICGDGIDNDCDGKADQYCQGLGTFVSYLTGDDANPGTKEKPLKTIGKGMANAQMIGHGVDVYVARGIYEENIDLVEGISLLGGWRCTLENCDWAMITDSEMPPSCIGNMDGDGVVAGAGITRDTVLDNMCIDATPGFANSFLKANALTINGGSPTIRNTFIGGPLDLLGMMQFTCSTAYGVEVLATGDPPPLFDNVIVYSGECIDGTAVAVQMTGNSALEVRDSDIEGGIARVAIGMRLQNGARAWIDGSNLDGGWCDQVPMNGQSFAVRAELRSELYIDRSYVNTLATFCNCVDGDVNPNNDPWCAGVSAVEAANLAVTNSVVFGLGSPRSAAVWVTAGGNSDVVVNGNVLLGGPVDSDNPFPPDEVAALLIEAIGGNHPAGRYRNNVLRVGSTTPQTSYGVFEQGVATHPLVEAFTNNDLFGLDVAYRSWNGSSAQTLATVDQLTSLPYALDNFDDDCMLDIGYHLPAASPCIDRGSPEEASDHDLDNEARPRGEGIDVGADESN